jgi:hypothetical protein
MDKNSCDGCSKQFHQTSITCKECNMQPMTCLHSLILDCKEFHWTSIAFHKGFKNTLLLQEETMMLMMYHCFISLQPSIIMEQPYLAQDDWIGSKSCFTTINYFVILALEQHFFVVVQYHHSLKPLIWSLTFAQVCW